MTMKKAKFTSKTGRHEVRLNRTAEGLVAERVWFRGKRALPSRTIARRVATPHATKTFERLTAVAEQNGWDRA